MTSTRCAAALAAAVALIMLSGCIGTKEGWERAERVDQIHENAPDWFKESWETYLMNMRGQYGILAMDRMALGAGWIYCATGCTLLLGNQGQSHKSLWAIRALDQCEEVVRKGHPVARPDCDIYAVKDEIVWPHQFPWYVEPELRPSMVRE